MSLMLIFYEFCLVIMSAQILKINNTVSAHVFPEIKFPFSSTKFNLKDIFSKFYNISDVISHKSKYIDDLKHVILNINKLASKLYEKINDFIQNPDCFLHDLKLNKLLWKLTDLSSSKFNVSDFNLRMEKELFGQHIVSCYLPNLLNNHLRKNKIMKPLLLSFQGQTGSGKSFVSKMVVESLFQEGFKSKFVHTYYGSRDFFHEKEKENYQQRLLHEIPFLLSLSDRPVFIFEEMDKMVPGVLDVILPFIYSYSNSTESFGANSIFIFISNSGAKRIEEILYDAWLEGVPREDMTLAMFSSCLQTAAYDEPGGLQNSEIIKRNLIDMFLPFLPLEKEHVKQCVLRELKLRNVPLNKNKVEYITDQIIFHPPEFEIFAEGGCKRVPQKVDLFGDIEL